MTIVSGINIVIESAVCFYNFKQWLLSMFKFDRTRFDSRRMSISTSDAADCLKEGGAEESALFTYTFWSISGINYYFLIMWQVHTRSTGIEDTSCEVWSS